MWKNIKEHWGIDMEIDEFGALDYENSDDNLHGRSSKEWKN